jgi:hypothetical protein
VNVKVTAYDIRGGEAREDIGTFESVRVTGREVRDPDGNVLLNFYDECWFSAATGNGWYDFTIEAIA